MVAFDAGLLSRSLIGGLDIQEFNRDVRERRAARFEAAIDLEQLDHLCSLSKLESLFKREAIPIGHIDIYDGGHLRKLVDVQRKSGKSGFAVVADNFRRGATIRVRDVDKFDAALNCFAGEVQRYFTAEAQINVYLTPPGRTGFSPHFDITDVFIVQCLGRKEWQIFNEYSDKIELPLMETRWDPERFRPSAPAEAITMTAGDVLYLPRGVMHEAFCTDRESMHLTMSVTPLTFADLIAKALTRVAEGDIEFRRRVPWSVESEDGDLEELLVQVRERILELADRIDVAALLRVERRSFEQEPEAGSSANELESAIASLRESARSEPRGVQGASAT